VQEVHNHYYETPVETTVATTQPYDDFSDVRMKLQVEKLEQEIERLKEANDLPNEATAADANFEQAVQAFGTGQYEEAILKFRVAMILDPDDMILPFAYSQALFANSDHEASVAVLRTILNQMPRDEDKETVFYPRGLYEDETLLNAQIDGLLAAIVAKPTDPDLNLLYAYHMLGTGQLDKAVNPLAIAAQDPANQTSVEILTNLLEKLKADEANKAKEVAMLLAK
jgi:tetratricopeptide (TPR) repeat protein